MLTYLLTGCILGSLPDGSQSDGWGGGHGSPGPPDSYAYGFRISEGVKDCPSQFKCNCVYDVASSQNVQLLSQFVSQQTGMILPRTVTSELAIVHISMIDCR